MPVGELVAAIDSNKYQALSDAHPDELRSASHACRNALDDNDTNLQIIFRRERVLERASALSSCPLLSIRKAQLLRSTPFGSRYRGWMQHDTRNLGGVTGWGALHLRNGSESQRSDSSYTLPHS